MKKMILLMSVLITFSSFAEDVEILEPRTLRDLSEDTNYPIKKLRSQLDLNIGSSDYDRPLREFGISVQRVKQALSNYEEGERRFLWNIVATGMIIVFIALIATGIVVALLEYFHRLSNRKGRRKTAPTSEPDAEATAPVSEGRRRRLAAAARRAGTDEQPDVHTIVAIATAIRLHESSIEESNRILATWKNASVSVWKTDRMMPNRRFFNSRWGKE